MKNSIDISRLAGHAPNVVPPGSPDFRKLTREEMALCLQIGNRAYEMARVARTTKAGTERLSSIQVSSMIVAAVHLKCRLDLNRFLTAGPFEFWDEICLIAEKIVTQPVVLFPDGVKLRFALPK